MNNFALLLSLADKTLLSCPRTNNTDLENDQQLLKNFKEILVRMSPHCVSVANTSREDAQVGHLDIQVDLFTFVHSRADVTQW